MALGTHSGLENYKDSYAQSRGIGSTLQAKGASTCTCYRSWVTRFPLNVVQRWLGHSRLETTAICSNAVGAEEGSLARRTWEGLEGFVFPEV